MSYTDITMKKVNVMLSAKQAAQLAEAAVPNVDGELLRLLDTIESLAAQGKRECRTEYDHKEDLDIWINGGFDEDLKWKAATQKLKQLGYKVNSITLMKVTSLTCTP